MILKIHPNYNHQFKIWYTCIHLYNVLLERDNARQTFPGEQLTNQFSQMYLVLRKLNS